MISEHLSSQQMKAYRERTLSPDELLDVDAHLTHCDSCRLKLLDPAALPHAVLAFKSEWHAAEEDPLHLEFEQLAGYLDNRLGEVDREIAESHLELCETCAMELADLRALRAALSTFPAQEPAPSKSPTLWSQLGALWTQRFRMTLPGGVAVAAIAALLVLALALPIGRQLGQQNAVLRRRAQTWQRESLALMQANRRLTQQVAQLDVQAKQAAEIQRQHDTALRQIEIGKRREQDQNRLLGGLRARIAGLENSLSLEGRSVVALNDGQARLTRDSSGSLVRMERLPHEVAAVLAGAPLAIPALARNFATEQSRLMGGPDKAVRFAVVYPVATLVLSDRPTFAWQPRPQATSYRVMVTRERPGGEPLLIVESESITVPRWQPAQLLPRGEKLEWQVLAYRNQDQIDAAPQPPLPEATFQIMMVSQAAELERDRERYAHSPLTLGVFYARAGLLQEAREQFEALVKANPKSKIAVRLLDTVRGMQKNRS